MSSEKTWDVLVASFQHTCLGIYSKGFLVNHKSSYHCHCVEIGQTLVLPDVPKKHYLKQSMLYKTCLIPSLHSTSFSWNAFLFSSRVSFFYPSFPFLFCLPLLIKGTIDSPFVCGFSLSLHGYTIFALCALLMSNLSLNITCLGYQCVKSLKFFFFFFVSTKVVVEIFRKRLFEQEKPVVNCPKYEVNPAIVEYSR